MFDSLRNLWRLGKAGRTFARYDFFLPPTQVAALPWYARLSLQMARLGGAVPPSDVNSQVSEAVASLGPSYIKLGQFLATRPDVIGAARAFELKSLQDRLPPFSMEEAREVIIQNLGQTPETLYVEFGPPVAAASIAQVHRARTRDGREVAVKILRPGIEKRFSDDLKSFFFAARAMEFFSKEGRRLRPVATVEMLEHSMRQELDLRMEAAAISEVGDNTKHDPGFKVPEVDWARTSRQVMTTSWISGTPISDVAALQAQGFDLIALGDTVIQSFLRQAIRDGFFHADMHQGNLLVDEAGNLVAVDFGITGRLSDKERLFLAEILYGFITRDYRRVAQVHFDAGYVPRSQNVHDFAQAIRTIGEPIFGLPAHEISMARLLTHLLEVTSQFDMHTQPQLLLLQKTMVVVEGVARTLNPDLNMWRTSEPVVRQFIERKLGPIGKLETTYNTLMSFGKLMALFPTVATEVVDEGGLKLGEETVKRMSRVHLNGWLSQKVALIICAAALTVIAIKLVVG